MERTRKDMKRKKTYKRTSKMTIAVTVLLILGLAAPVLVFADEAGEKTLSPTPEIVVCPASEEETPVPDVVAEPATSEPDIFWGPVVKPVHGPVVVSKSAEEQSNESLVETEILLNEGKPIVINEIPEL